ncbi:MAG: hypothetical protein OXI56_05785 [bacterium]|nr:hypothetical protein [bacterium]MDE0601288.1 hypothetical protein [bacterium]
MTVAVRQNHDAYKEHREDIEREHLGKIVLMHDGQVVSTHEDYIEAYIQGCAAYGLGNFLIKRVGEEPAKLGYLAYRL